MTDTVKIDGKKLGELLSYLIAHQTILSIQVLGTDYERLTYIITIDEDPGGRHLIIDLPEAFQQAVAGMPTWRLGFNFNGPDQVEYSFSIEGGEFHPHGLRIPFPVFIERLQRRRNFRILVPSGTRMAIDTEYSTGQKLNGLVNLINISLGGAYGVLTKHNMKNAPEPVLKIGQHIHTVGIIFPGNGDMEERIVLVKSLRVCRIDHDPEKHLFKYAFEFLALDPGQHRKLTQTIYHIQRQFLMRR